MGRQYNYFISPEEELEFAIDLMNKGFLILEAQEIIKDSKVVWEWKTLSLDDISIKKKFFQLSATHIYREEWGELKKSQETYTDLREASPIIEHVHCTINKEHNLLTRGRFWLDTYYKDEIGSFDAVYKGFQRLVRMMQKRIDYKRYEFENGQSVSYPLSQKAVDLIKSGYKRGI